MSFKRNRPPTFWIRLVQRRSRLRVHVSPGIVRRCAVTGNAAGAGAGAGTAASANGGAEEGRLRVPGAGPSAEYLCVSGTLAAFGGVVLAGLLCGTSGASSFPTLIASKLCLL